MRPLLTMSEAELHLLKMKTLPTFTSRDRADLLAELDAQRAEPTREPGEAAPSGDVLPWLRQAVLDYETESYRPSAHYLKVFRGAITAIEKAQVDAATIRRQVLEEAIVELRNYGEHQAIAALEALRDGRPADAERAGSE